MASISSLGVGSNLDLSTLLDTLTTNENKRLDPITSKKTSINATTAAYGTLKTALDTFNTATKALTDKTLYTKKVASATTGFTTTVGDSAVSGSYNIKVTQLATAQSLATKQVFSDTTSQIGASSTDRKLSIQVGSGKEVSISLTDAQTTLAGVRDAINASGAGVTASIVQSKDNGYQLVVASNTTGTASNMTLSVTGDDTLKGILNYSSAATDSDADRAASGMAATASQDAELTMNGITVVRSSNTITDVPQGVTLTLAATNDTAQNLIIRQSATDSAKAVEDWVTAYNTLQTTFNTLTKYTAVTSGSAQDASNGALLGDSVLRSVKTQLKTAISSAQSNDTFKVLNQLGVTLNKDGTLTTDETALVKNLANNPAKVADFFIGDGKTTGLATQMSTILTSFTADHGTIADAQDSLSDVLTGLDKQYTQVQSSIDANIARYKKQFTQLDVLVNSLNSTANYLTQQFDAISNMSSSK
ncbi:flagellar filament capping protein FliD [Sodalis sp. RH21]|uniref:flagellar filament capping protein FliD n=1 Tax=unclassified Sodalis (in: enterobacteria) TaxID=2636512 RepID=UPI0039B5108E